MSASNATVNVLNIPLSPMRITFGGTQVGGTVGDVTLSIKMKMSPIKVDQFGDSEIDDVVTGLHYSIKTTLAETKNKDNWKTAFPSMKEITSGGNKAIYSDMAVGDHLYPKAKQLILHPLENTDADLSEDYLFYKASCQNAAEVKYGPSKQTGLAVEFKIYPDTGTVPARYMFHGDPALGLVAASAAGAVAGANTGNGTLDTISVFSGVTLTETITALCVGSSGSGSEFAVSGSVSGSLGIVNLPAANASQVTFIPASGSPQVINFKLHQSTVQFVLGDSFTIATTASNYA